MQAAPEMRKPAVVETAGFQNTEMLPSKFDVQEHATNCLQLQATRLRNRFAVSWPLARVVASLAYGEAH